MDHCNSLLNGAADYQLQRLHLIQNAAARSITGLKKFDHVSSALRDLRWLPVRQRITFKIATLVFKCLHGLAPPYLAELCVVHTGVLSVGQSDGRYHRVNTRCPTDCPTAVRESVHTVGLSGGRSDGRYHRVNTRCPPCVRRTVRRNVRRPVRRTVRWTVPPCEHPMSDLCPSKCPTLRHVRLFQHVGILGHPTDTKVRLSGQLCKFQLLIIYERCRSQYTGTLLALAR